MLVVEPDLEDPELVAGLIEAAEALSAGKRRQGRLCRRPLSAQPVLLGT